MELLREMSALIARHAFDDGVHECGLERVRLIRSATPTEPVHTIYKPTVCFVVQGRKQAMLGDRAFIYDPSSYLIVSVDLPVVGSVIEATLTEPYLCVSLDIDLSVLAELALDHDPPRAGETPPAIALSSVEPELLDATCRLLRLLDNPRDAKTLAPLAEREILYRLLTGEQGAMMRHISAIGSRLGQVSRAIAWLKDNYASAMSVDQLAAYVGMSPSSFHHHFRAVTSMSPVQYRTQLRLQEARRLMVAEGADAASAGFRVGYESPSQFSREYSRLFGMPPLKHAARLRTLPQYGLVA